VGPSETTGDRQGTGDDMFAMDFEYDVDWRLTGLPDVSDQTRERWCSLEPQVHGHAEVDGTLSSQFITGLALAAAGLPRGGTLRWTRPPASPSYLALTCRWLRAFGCEAALHEDRLVVPGSLRAADLDLPVDWSGAAAFLAAAAVTGRALTLGPLDATDSQGDRALVDILTAAGCEATWAGPLLTLQVHDRLRAAQRSAAATVGCSLDLERSRSTVTLHATHWSWQGQDYPYFDACKDRAVLVVDPGSGQDVGHICSSGGSPLSGAAAGLRR